MLKWQKARHHVILHDVRRTSTEHPGFLEPSEPLHDSDRLLDPIFGVQFTRARVRRREVAISTQPVLDTHIQQSDHLGVPLLWIDPFLVSCFLKADCLYRWAQLRRMKNMAAGTQSCCDRPAVIAGKVITKRFWNLSWQNAVKEKALAWLSTATFLWFLHCTLK